MEKRNTYKPEFKTKVVLEVLREAKTVKWGSYTEYLVYNTQEMAFTFCVVLDGQPIGEGTLIMSEKCSAIGNRKNLGVEAKETRNLSIYFHWGYNVFVMSEIEDGELVLYYKKTL